MSRRTSNVPVGTPGLRWPDVAALVTLAGGLSLAGIAVRETVRLAGDHPHVAALCALWGVACYAAVRTVPLVVGAAQRGAETARDGASR